MNSSRLCPVCGSKLSGDAPRGLCPQCLLGQVLGEASISKPGSKTPNRTVRYFGDYELLGEIAQGGMGVVYYARQVSLNRTVALKMIRAGQLASAAEVQRFHTEAEAAANLDHPNIVPIYEIGEHEGQQYFSMKLMEGGTLAELNAECGVRNTAWLRHAAELVATVARAVSHAHQRGVLHRDLKPTNILLDEQGEPHLTDFGLAKLVQDRPNVTESLAVLGTPGYMSPEQAAGRTKQLTTAADIYSLGAVLFELLTGEAPFKGDSTLEILKQVQEQSPESPRKLNPHLDADLETICLKCLEKEPRHRYATAEALAQDLDHWRRNEPILARRSTTWERTVKWTRRNPVVASLTAAAMLIFLTGLAGVIWEWRAAKAEAVRADQNASRADANATESRQRLARSRVANGNRLLDQGDLFEAMLWFAEALRLEAGDPAREARHRLRLASVLRQSPRLHRVMNHGASVMESLFTKDGKRLLTGGEDGVVWIWDLESGQRALGPLNHRGTIAQAAFIEHDRAIIVTPYNSDGVSIWDAQTGQRRSFLEHPGVWAMHPSTNDGWLLTCGTREGSFRIWNPRTGEAQSPMLHHGTSQCVGTMSPSGDSFATAGNDGTVIIWDRATLSPRFPPIKQAGSVAAMAFSGDGRHLVVVNFWKSFQIWDATTGKAVSGVIPQVGMNGLDLSSDGQRFAAIGAYGRVRVWDSLGENFPLAELQHDSNPNDVALDSLGKRLAVGCGDGTAYVWKLDRREPVCIRLKHSQKVSSVSFGPDADWLVTCSADGAIRVWDCSARDLAFSPWPAPPVNVLDVGTAGHLLTLERDQSMKLWNTRTWQAASASLPVTNLPARAWLSQDAGRLVIQGVESYLNLFTSGLAKRRNFEFQTWEPASGRMIASMNWNSDPSGRAWASPDCKRLMLAEGGELRAFDTASWQLLWQRKLSNPVQFVAFNPRADLAAVLAGKEIHLVQSTDGQAVLQPFKVAVNAMHAEFSPDGKRLATASGDIMGGQVAFVWDCETGQALTPPMHHTESIWSIAFSLDGQRLVTASRGRTARVWNSHTGQPLTPPLAHAATVNDAAFSPDSQSVATFCDDGTARVWEVATGEPLTPPLEHAAKVGFGRFLADGRHIFTQSRAGSTALWELPTDNRPIADWSAVASLLSARRFNAAGFMETIAAEELAVLWNTLRSSHPADFAPIHGPAGLASQPTALPPSSAPTSLNLGLAAELAH